MDPNLLYWKSHGQVSVACSFTPCRASSVTFCYSQPVLTSSFLFSFCDNLSCSFPLFQSFLSRLQIWVDLVDPTSLLASDVSISHHSDLTVKKEKYLYDDVTLLSPQAEIHKAHALLCDGEKLNEKV